MNAIYRAMAKPPESNWRISDGSDDMEEAEETAWTEGPADARSTLDRVGMPRILPGSSDSGARFGFLEVATLSIIVVAAVGIARYFGWL
jgi:hypothetical protein